jgi:two-component system chemotaxis response regulator CheY
MGEVIAMPDVRKLAVLVVEDDVAMLRMLVRLLREIGFGRIEQAADGAAAVQKLNDAPPDLVISDWTMTPMSGLELLRHVRADRRLKELPFVMVTGKNDEDGVAAAKAAGVNGYLLKPFNILNLQKQLARVLPRDE